MTTTSLWLKEPQDSLPRSRSEGRAEAVVLVAVSPAELALFDVDRAALAGSG